MNGGLLTLIKIALTVLLLPVLWACGEVFVDYIASLPGSYGEFFFWGMFGFLMLFLFFYQFWGVYEFGQKIMTGLFKFTFPVGKIFVRTIPFYLTLVFLLYFVVVNFLQDKSSPHYFMFFAGFTFTLHVLLTAQDLQQQEQSVIKPAYLLVMGVEAVLMVFVTVLLFDLVFMKFSFPDFFADLSDEAISNYARVWNMMVTGK